MKMSQIRVANTQSIGICTILFVVDFHSVWLNYEELCMQSAMMDSAKYQAISWIVRAIALFGSNMSSIEHFQ